MHKSLRDIRPLLYSSRDGHAEGEHVNTPKFLFCLTGARYVLSAVSVLVVAQPSSEVLVGLINYPVLYTFLSGVTDTYNNTSATIQY
jgi:hypothetical protein